MVMALAQLELSGAYWQTLEITDEDIEFIYGYLLEKETPLPLEHLAEALVAERIRSEEERLKKKQKEKGKIYLPKDTYQVGEKIQFPALNWFSGEISDIREGHNPELPELQVLTVQLENGSSREFAANLADHSLNDIEVYQDEGERQKPEDVLENFSDEIIIKLERKLEENKDLVRIGPDWFPKSLLIEFNVGHLNLAEAVLDMHDGGPLPVNALLDQIDVDTDDPQELLEFSMNYALQEDSRFDEVGPRGVVLWFLNRLEPEYVREKPLQLIYSPLDYDRNLLSEDMRKAEARIDDELASPDPEFLKKKPGKEVLVTLNYPHWRVGSIPLTYYTRPFFPTALETPRVKFKLIDSEGEEISAWVVRPHNYVYGLREWYEEQELMPGNVIRIKQGKNPGEVLIEPEKKRSNREWIRTLLIGADGGIVFAMLKQMITADFNERMTIAVPSTDVLDELWQKRANNPRPLNHDMKSIMNELAKLNPQGHVHGVELYAALNCLRRCPPGLIFGMLASDPDFVPVGDLYFRLKENS
jgi:hypothetical protein